MSTAFVEAAVQTDWRAAFCQALTGQGESTRRDYLRHVAVFERWFEAANGQAFSPELLNSWDLRAFREWELYTAKRQPATWNAHRAALRALVSWAQQAGHVSHDPMAEVGKADQVDEAPKWLEKAEFGRLMRQAEIGVNAVNTPLRRYRAIRDAAMVAVMVFAGLRESEMAHLLVEDVELGERSGRVIVRRGKRDKLRRVPLSSDARRALSAWLEVRGAGEGYLFSGENGSPLSARAIQKRIGEIGKAAGIEGLTPHRLRHTCIKRMIDAGRPLTEAQAIAGHRKIETTARYAMAGWEDLEEAVESITLGKMRRN